LFLFIYPIEYLNKSIINNIFIKDFLNSIT
jgi:hypothetical protein